MLINMFVILSLLAVIGWAYKMESSFASLSGSQAAILKAVTDHRNQDIITDKQLSDFDERITDLEQTLSLQLSEIMRKLPKQER